MNAIKRSDVVPAGGAAAAVAERTSETKRQQSTARTSANSQVGNQTPSEVREQPQQTASGSKRVFGLNPRANRGRHDENTEQRLLVAERDDKQAAAIGQTTLSSKTNSKSAPAEGQQYQEQQHQQQKQRAGIRASKYGNFYKPQDVLEQNNHNQNDHQHLPAVRHSPKPQPTTDGGHQPPVAGIHLTQSTKDSLATPATDVQFRRPTTPKTEASTTPNTTTIATTTPRTKKMARRKSIEEDLSTKKTADTVSSNSNSTPNLNQPEPEPEQQQEFKMRTKFNILPPPQLSMATSGKGSVVSYAKSRIYDKPSKQQTDLITASSNGCGGSNNNNNNNNDTTSSNWSPSASSVLFNQSIPASILSGFKPPKQVNVSKARKEWEGGEPFAKCKSRQRLAAKAAAAAASLSGKKHLHGTWSMTSVVATQQLQLQQALAQSSAGVRSNVEQSDPSVKVLTRGSVLERVQQYERAPAASTGGRSRSSSSSRTTTSSPLEATAVMPVEVDDSELVDDGERPISPTSASKQAQYRTRIASIQHEQHVAEAVPSVESTASSRGLANEHQSSTPASTKPTTNHHQPTDTSRAVQRRRSSSGLAPTTIPTAGAVQPPNSNHRVQRQLPIPRFYHPHGKRPNTYELEQQKKNIVACFDRLPDRKAQLVGPSARRHFHSIALACGLSEYFKVPLNLYAKHLMDTNKLSTLTVGRRRTSVAAPISMATTTPNGTDTGNRMPMRSIRRTNSIATNSQPNSRTMGGQLTRAASMDSTGKPAGSGGGGDATAKNEPLQFISCDQFLIVWRHLTAQAYDNSSKFIHLLTQGQRDHLLPEDFMPLLQSIIDDHPGLKFLRAAPDFHLRYIQTVIARIYFNINRSWTGKISLSELRRSNLLAVLLVLSQEEDINQITDYFSYEHFYVIYCKFWNLDQDHDLLISKEDLARHQEASISSRIIERIFTPNIVLGSLSSTTSTSAAPGKMTYSDFVWFLLAEEDKKHPRSIEYWFRLMDLDGDGFISMYEMEYFYYEQMRRLELMNIEPLPFLDCACQILDLVNPREKSKISLADLKRTRMAPIFFDTFINLEKYLEHESREFVSTRDHIQDGVIISDWDRYASEEYENLVTEESSV